ncbi:hypothetical protein [Gudongella oleilytica]|uniref:hypothetical protein n=1 Tax=Gudongella oleilytica TaxID=1582259 RepID=UPI002A369456|nr:hypothetical protein [Gudongella oleilytica]MDY0257307.1 hypothetical protein [Gudongella oleilytica]
MELAKQTKYEVEGSWFAPLSGINENDIIMTLYDKADDIFNSVKVSPEMREMRLILEENGYRCEFLFYGVRTIINRIHRKTAKWIELNTDEVGYIMEYGDDDDYDNEMPF